MTTRLKSARRRQTVQQFMDMFMRDYDTENASEKTFKSPYVPYSIKSQLIAKLDLCESKREIEYVARLGVYIDVSCRELKCYNNMLGALVRWLASMYIESEQTVMLLSQLLDDVGRIGDDEMSFIVEKYAYLDRNGLEFETGGGLAGALSFFKRKRFNPDTSLFGYYSGNLLTRLFQSIIKNCFKLFNQRTTTGGPLEDVFAGLFSDGCNDELSAMDESARNLYNRYTASRDECTLKRSALNADRIRNVMQSSSSDEENKWREPPVINNTAFDLTTTDNYTSSDSSDSEMDSQCTVRTVIQRQKKDSVKSQDQPLMFDMNSDKHNDPSITGQIIPINIQTLLSENGKSDQMVTLTPTIQGAVSECISSTKNVVSDSGNVQRRISSTIRKDFMAKDGNVSFISASAMVMNTTLDPYRDSSLISRFSEGQYRRSDFRKQHSRSALTRIELPAVQWIENNNDENMCIIKEVSEQEDDSKVITEHRTF